MHRDIVEALMHSPLPTSERPSHLLLARYHCCPPKSRMLQSCGGPSCSLFPGYREMECLALPTEPSIQIDPSQTSTTVTFLTTKDLPLRSTTPRCMFTATKLMAASINSINSCTMIDSANAKYKVPVLTVTEVEARRQ